MDGKESIELTEVNKSHDCQPSKLADAEKQGSVKGKNHSYKYREYLETVLLSVVIVIVTLVLLLPTIIYTLPLPSVSSVFSFPVSFSLIWLWAYFVSECCTAEL